MEIGSDYNLNIKFNKNKLFYFSGRIAIKEILNKIKKQNEKCLIPNYLCNSIFNCFSNYEYYKIDNDFDIDIDYLQNKIKNNKYKCIFIINYFGYIDKNIEYISKLCRKNNIIIIEDFTHNVYSENLYGDISICSYRKSLSTPYGAIVIDKYKYLNIKQITSIDLIYSGFDYLNNFFYKYYYDSNNKYIRLRNIEFLSGKLNIKTLDKFKKTYFTYPILFKTKETRNKIRKILIKNAIFCPIYWPLDFDENNHCNQYISDHILCIPADQRYNIKNMEYIASIINQHL